MYALCKNVCLLSPTVFIFINITLRIGYLQFRGWLMWLSTTALKSDILCDLAGTLITVGWCVHNCMISLWKAGRLTIIPSP